MLISKHHHEEVVDGLNVAMAELRRSFNDLMPKSQHEEVLKVHQERIAQLEKELSEARAELRSMAETQTAYIFGQVIRDGKRTMFDPRAEQQAVTGEIPLKPTEEQQRMSEVEEARRATGSKDVRVITRYIEKQNRKRYTEKLRHVPEDFMAAEAEGRAQANTEATA